MKLGIVMPAYNREKFIGSALRSLLRQRHEVDMDIIVIDDGSTDGTREVVKAFMRDNPEIRLFTQANAGVSAARNSGLRNILPGTEMISFLDSDDISPPGRFQTDMRHFDADPALGLVYTWMKMIDLVDEEKLEAGPGSRTLVFRGIQVGAGIYRRELLDRIGGFDEGLVQAEDLDFLFRIFERNTPHLFPETVGVYYRKHNESLTARRAEGHRAIVKACHKSLMRRKADPTLGTIHHLIQTDPRFRNAV